MLLEDVFGSRIKSRPDTLLEQDMVRGGAVIEFRIPVNSMKNLQGNWSIHTKMANNDSYQLFLTEGWF